MPAYFAGGFTERLSDKHDMAGKRTTAASPEYSEATGSLDAFTRKRGVVIGATLLAMVLAAGVSWFAIAAMSKEASAMNLLPIRSVSFSSGSGELQHVDPEELKHIAGAIQNMGGSMLRTDLNQVKAAVKQVEWVRDAEVRRHFPSTLEVRIEEHLPFARWLSAADSEQSFLVNTFGEVFEADIDDQVVLPILGGPKDSSREVMTNYQSFKTQLAAIEQVPAEVRLSPRRAWQVKLASGSTLELGRNDAGERLQRFVRAYAGISAIRTAGTRVDLRYQNGLAVRVAARPAADKNTRKAAAKS